MIDHISIGVRDLEAATEFYAPILELIGFELISEKPGTVGFGKKYPEFWLNHRPDLAVPYQNNGTHICLRAKNQSAVDGVYTQALRSGAISSGEPGYRPEYHDTYYACFFRDRDYNHIEVVTFVQPEA